jgi:hypothetical protein
MRVSSIIHQFAVGDLPEAGLSDREIYKRKDQLEFELAIVPRALARGDVTVVREEMEELLNAFQLNVDRESLSYCKLGMAVLAAHVRALKAIEKRNSGEVIDTPQDAYGPLDSSGGERGGTLREAFEGWKKERERPEGTVHEYGRAIEMFISLVGNLAILDIKRSHYSQGNPPTFLKACCCSIMCRIAHTQPAPVSQHVNGSTKAIHC